MLAAHSVITLSLLKVFSAVDGLLSLLVLRQVEYNRTYGPPPKIFDVLPPLIAEGTCPKERAGFAVRILKSLDLVRRR